ncbi:MAG: fused MFS/spermidine synthase [Planctomycetota bacterium]|nr:fused MFS/spermidine synthase [Planctomycetota bacterium]
MAATAPARAAPILAAAAIAGAGTMTVELAAVRMLAPWFGTSLVVWTNVIGVILLALALGYLVGGRLSAGAAPVRRLGIMLLAASALTAWLPWLAGFVAAWVLPSGLTLDEAAPVVLWGSLAASLLLFLPPAALLGSAAPLAVEAVAKLEHHGAGSAGGRVLAASTVGSIVGVFATSHVLVPRAGITWTFLIAAGLLALAGLVVLLRARARGDAVLVLVLGGVTVLACAGSRLARPALPEGWVELEARESPYQSVRVVEDRRGVTIMRFLQVNEGFDSFQSVWQPEPGLLPEGFYYNYFVLPLWWSERRENQTSFDVQVLGLGAGTAWRVLAGAAPPGLELVLGGVELDPEVIALAREHMDLDRDGERRHVVSGVDARVALRASDARHDLIILDCYANQIEIPTHLATLEFFREVREHLAPGGWLTANLGGFGFDDPVVRAVAATCAAALEEPVLLVRVPAARNFILYARRDGALPVTSDGLVPVPGEGGERLLAQLGVSGSFQLVAPGSGPVLTDDRNAIDRLQLESIRAAAERRRGRRREGS